MNRRSFLSKSALALFGFSILPSAGRIWKAEKPKLGYFLSEYQLGMNDGQIGNFLVRIDLSPLRFQRNPETDILELVNGITPVKFELTQHGGIVRHWKHYKV